MKKQLDGFSKISENVSFKGSVLIGSFTQIESGTTIGNNVIIHDEVIIGKNCIISDGVVINDNCVLADNTVIKENTILNKSVNIYKQNITIGSNCKIGVQSEICYNIEDNTTIKAFTMQGSTIKDIKLGQEINSPKDGKGIVTKKTDRTITIKFENGRTVKNTYKTNDSFFYVSDF